MIYYFFLKKGGSAPMSRRGVSAVKRKEKVPQFENPLPPAGARTSQVKHLKGVVRGEGLRQGRHADVAKFGA